MVDKELITQMLNRMDKLGDQQTDLLVKQSEISSEQKHLAISIETMKDDIASIKFVQSSHGSDIFEIKEALKDSESFTKFAKDFVLTHPILSFLILLMIINVIFASLGLPLIQIAAVAALFN